MVRYHGVLSSHAALRPQVVPEPVEDDPPPPPRQLDLLHNEETRLVRKPWAWLIRHVFLEDVSTCPKCSGPMRWLEVATSKEAVEQLLARHGMAPPPAPRPRAPPPGQLLLPFATV